MSFQNASSSSGAGSPPSAAALKRLTAWIAASTTRATDATSSALRLVTPPSSF